MSEMTIYSDYDDIQVIPLGPPAVVPPVASFNTVSILAQTAVMASPDITIDRNLGEWVTLTLTSDVDSITVNNWPPPGYLGRIHLNIFNQAAYQINAWPPGSVAANGSYPITTANGNDLIIMTTVDGGATVMVHVVGYNYLGLEVNPLR